MSQGTKAVGRKVSTWENVNRFLWRVAATVVGSGVYNIHGLYMQGNKKQKAAEANGEECPPPPLQSRTSAQSPFILNCYLWVKNDAEFLTLSPQIGREWMTSKVREGKWDDTKVAWIWDRARNQRESGLKTRAHLENRQQTNNLEITLHRMGEISQMKVHQCQTGYQTIKSDHMPLKKKKTLLI